MIFRDRRALRRGREWSLALDIGGAERLRDDLGIDLLDASGSWVEDLDANAGRCVDVMFVIAEPQCVARRVSSRQFGRLIARCFFEAHAAMSESLVRFFPEPDPNASTDGDGDEFGWDSLYGLAGFVGVDPRPLTLRQLCDMAKGRLEYESKLLWGPGATLAAILTNANSKRKVTVDDMNPWSNRHAAPDFSKPRRKPLMQ